MPELVGFGVLVVVVLGLGVAVGMLVAPHLTRLSERDEEPGDRDDPAG